MGKLAVLPMDVLLFVAFVAYCLFFKKRELGLIGTFIFVCYLSFVFARGPFIALGGEASSWVYVFGLASLGLTCLFLIGFAKMQSVSPEPQAKVEQQTASQEEPTESQAELQNQI